MALAISSFLILIVLSVTGTFLAVEPILQKTVQHKVAGQDTVSLATSLPLLKEKFEGIQEIQIDDNQSVIVK